MEKKTIPRDYLDLTHHCVCDGVCDEFNEEEERLQQTTYRLERIIKEQRETIIRLGKSLMHEHKTKVIYKRAFKKVIKDLLLDQEIEN